MSDLSDKHKYGHGTIDLENEEVKEQIKDIAKEVKNPVVGSGSEFYSTKEHRIGYWIDGKPLYRTVVSTTVSAINKWYDLSTTDILVDVDKVTRLYGISQYLTNGHTNCICMP